MKETGQSWWAQACLCWIIAATCTVIDFATYSRLQAPCFNRLSSARATTTPQKPCLQIFSLRHSPRIEDYNVPSTPYIIQQEFSQPAMCWLFTTSSVRAICIKKPHSPQLVQMFLCEPASPSPKWSELVITPLPAYNPLPFATCLPICLIGHPAVTLLTPSFRHSSARLPNWTSRHYLLITHYVRQYSLTSILECLPTYMSSSALLEFSK